MLPAKICRSLRESKRLISCCGTIYVSIHSLSYNLKIDFIWFENDFTQRLLAWFPSIIPLLWSDVTCPCQVLLKRKPAGIEMKLLCSVIFLFGLFYSNEQDIHIRNLFTLTFIWTIFSYRIHSHSSVFPTATNLELVRCLSAVSGL